MSGYFLHLYIKHTALIIKLFCIITIQTSRRTANREPNLHHNISKLDREEHGALAEN